MKSRSHAVKINTIFTLVGYILQIILGFAVRKIFIDYLGVEYLGYNSVFQNILQMLNLADLGIGVAITSFLYKPLADADKEKIASLMYIYKRVYMILGLIVLVAGGVVSFLLQFIIPDSQVSIWYLRLLFYINLAGTVSTYYLAYNRTLVIANQKSYVTTVIDTVSYLLASVLQCVSLVVAPNYIVYLVLNVSKNIFSNIIVSIEAHKEFRSINKYRTIECINQYKPQIVSYVKDVFVSRIGAYIYYSTDNIIISIFKGSLLTGYLSNYTLVTTQVNAVISQILSSLQATFGNYISVTGDKNKQRQMTDNYLCANFVVGNFCMLCVMFLIQPFVQLFFGSNMLLTTKTVVWLSINLLLTILITIPSQVFTIYKLFHYDRPIIITSAVLNIVISAALVGDLGIDGCLIGTFVTSLIYLFSRFWVISKRVYNIKYNYYVKKLLYYMLVSCVSVIALYFITRNIDIVNLKYFFLKIIVVGVSAIVITVLGVIFTKEFKFLVEKMIPLKLQQFLSLKKLKLILIVFMFMLLVISFVIPSNPYKPEAGNKSTVRTDEYAVDSSSNMGQTVRKLAD